LSATSQLPKQRPETEFVKDEYFVYNVENSSAGPWLSSIVENNYFFITENTTIRAGPIVLNDTSHSTAHEAGKKKRLYGQISKRNQFQSNSFFKRCLYLLIKEHSALSCGYAI
jgi:hypothetical protein